MGAKAPLKAAVLVYNRAGGGLEGKVGALTDLLTAGLSARGIRVLDRRDVASGLRASGGAGAEAPGGGVMLEGVAREGGAAEEVRGPDALRLAQMIGADYIILAAIDAVGQETRRFKGRGTNYATDNEVTSYTLRLTLKVLEGAQGSSIYGDVVTAEVQVARLENLEVDSDDIDNRLCAEAARKAADNVAGHLERLRAAKAQVGTEVETVAFEVACNVEGAAVDARRGADWQRAGQVPGRGRAAPAPPDQTVAHPLGEDGQYPSGPGAPGDPRLTEEGARSFRTMEGFRRRDGSRPARDGAGQTGAGIGY